MKCAQAAPTACGNDKDFWNLGNKIGYFTCRREEAGRTKYLHKSSCEPKICPDFECSNEWSQWTNKSMYDGTSILSRFCRRNNDCVIMETERMDENGNEEDDFVGAKYDCSRNTTAECRR